MGVPASDTPPRELTPAEAAMAVAVHAAVGKLYDTLTTRTILGGRPLSAVEQIEATREAFLGLVPVLVYVADDDVAVRRAMGRLAHAFLAAIAEYTTRGLAAFTPPRSTETGTC